MGVLQIKELKKRSNHGLHGKCDVLAPICLRQEMCWCDIMFEYRVSWIRHAKIRNKGKKQVILGHFAIRIV